MTNKILALAKKFLLLFFAIGFLFSLVSIERNFASKNAVLSKASIAQQVAYSKIKNISSYVALIEQEEYFVYSFSDNFLIDGPDFNRKIFSIVIKSQAPPFLPS